MQTAPAATPAMPESQGMPGPTPLPEGAEKAVFTLKDVRVVGVSAYDQATVDAWYAPWLNTDISLADMYRLADGITAQYHADGYIFSKAVVAAQTIEDGRVTIKVIEGGVQSVDLIGDYKDAAIIRAIVERIESLKPLNIADLERYLLLLNDLPGIAVSGSVLPAREGQAPGALGLAIHFTDEPFINNLSLDNYGSRFLGPVQAGVRLGENHSLAPYHQTMVAGYNSLPVNELNYVFLSHILPLHAEGTKLRVSGNYARTESGYTLEPLDVEGRSYGVNIELTHAMLRSRRDNLYLHGGLEWNHSETDALGSNLFDDDLRVLRIGFDYDGSDDWWGSNYASFRASQGFDLLGASDAGEANLSRAEGSGSFSKLSGSLARLQSLGNLFDAYAQFSGQVADGPLLSSEEFGYGGQSVGRAYDNSEITGDHGVSGLLELRYTGLSAWRGWSGQPYLFYDGGKVYNDDRDGENVSATSAGAGVRWNYDGVLSGDVGLAWPLTLNPGAPLSSNPGDPRAFLSLNLRF